ncbi:3783_t:CDS:2 [Cetraspora pellucida]|uniref:3783_t:CDS:1 n=1 Tax=Cetraspora pellucida TaxID=1433469 RepID=A0A9N9AMR5_9GLOM|nr:3783_t:CDS:2 [Cetraspora pellucida]
MRNDIFSEWLINLNRKFHLQNRQVLLLVDNALSHFHNQPSTHETYESNESNSDLDEETSNNSELEVTTVSRRNRRGRGRPRLTRTNQGANNSHSNHDKHDKHSIGESKGHYSSGYSQPHQIIVNCWRKTRILSSVSHEKIEVAIKSQDMLLEQQEEDVNDLEKLEDSEIIEIVIDKANQSSISDFFTQLNNEDDYNVL